VRATCRGLTLSTAARLAVAASDARPERSRKDRRVFFGGFAGHRVLLKFLLTLLLALRLQAAPAPVVFQSAPGRFEVAAVEAGAAERVAARAEEGWRALAGPLGLPERFSTPVFVRLVPAAEWRDATPFRVVVEPGGVVSVRVEWGERTSDFFLRRALVQSLLMRLAVAQHGVTEKLAAPLWLELGCVGWWQTRADAAQFDALKQESGRFPPPSLGDLLTVQRGEGEARGVTVGAVWLFAWLQAESGRAGEWPALLRDVLGGGESGAALARNFPGRFASDAERELWWQTGWHHLRRLRTLPTLESAESHDELAGLARFVFSMDGRDVVTPIGTVLAHAREPRVDAELRQRAAELNRILPALHPFYRNAGLSLAEAFNAGASAESMRRARVAAFERDWSEALELEAATSTALDALERHDRGP
jgi:hypothetical protein